MIKKPDTGELLKFLTEEIHEDKTGNGNLVAYQYARVTVCDADLKDLTQPTVYEINVTPEEFHKDLRKKAAEHNQLITSHSTDPEWNPEGYTKNLS
jgi:hypothetical protein